jgi:FMN phosphatase YigB (HAD superfamily)
VPGLALFDLDNTLVDRRGAFSAWASSFVGSLGGGPRDLAWLLDADRDGQAPRTTLFVAVKERWDLAESVDALVAAYRRTRPTSTGPSRRSSAPSGN